MITVIGNIITVAYVTFVGWWLFKLDRRLIALERTRPSDNTSATSINANTMRAVDDTSAMITGLRNRLISDGFPPDVANELVLQVIRGAAGSRK